MPKYETKNRTVAIALGVLAGGLGAHRFYLGEIKMGILYLVFFWTFIPLFVGLYDAYKYYRAPELFGEGRGSMAATEPPQSAERTTSQPTTVSETPDGRDPSASNSSASASGLASSVKKGASSVKASASEAAQNMNEKAQKASEEAQKASEQPETPPGALKAVRGVNGTVTLYEDRLEISRDDIGMVHKLQHGFKGDKEIPLEAITGIQLRKPTSRTRGYIQFGQSGYSESDDGILDAVSDENTVLFNKGAYPLFEDLRSAVREQKSGDVKSSTETMDGAMEKLRERYATGEIDEEEYEQRKEVLQSD